MICIILCLINLKKIYCKSYSVINIIIVFYKVNCINLVKVNGG